MAAIIQSTRAAAMTEQGRSAIEIDAIICTYNRAARLDAVLAALERQCCGADIAWRVLVVDNASTDETARIVAARGSQGTLPGLRYVFEPTLGLTNARLRGARETNAPWIAFIDDDNMLEPTWLMAIASAIRAHPDAGGIGGRVELDWEVPPPAYLKEFGFCFAEQNHGDTDKVVESLAGAGLVLRRSALVESGWLERPLVADRVGKSLRSGGDVEMVQRVRAAGYTLWFTPHAMLKHRMPTERMTRRYLFRINRELGACSALISLLTWPGDWQSWHGAAAERRQDWYRLAWRGLKYALRRRRGLTPAVAWACFALGYAIGVRRCGALSTPQTRVLLGAATCPKQPNVRSE